MKRAIKYILLTAILIVIGGRLTEWADADNYPKPVHQRAAGHGYVVAPGHTDDAVQQAALWVATDAIRVRK